MRNGRNMKYLFCVLLASSCLVAMDRHAIHSSSNFPPIIHYWHNKLISTLSMYDIEDPEAISLYCYLHTLAQHEPGILNLTPQELVCEKLSTVYKVIYAKEAPKVYLSTSRQTLIEETARTVEGLLDVLLKTTEKRRI